MGYRYHQHSELSTHRFAVMPSLMRSTDLSQNVPRDAQQFGAVLLHGQPSQPCTHEDPAAREHRRPKAATDAHGEAAGARVQVRRGPLICCNTGSGSDQTKGIGDIKPGRNCLQEAECCCCRSHSLAHEGPPFSPGEQGREQQRAQSRGPGGKIPTAGGTA